MKYVTVQLWEPSQPPVAPARWRRVLHINLLLLGLELFAVAAVHECEDEPEPAPATRMMYD